MSVPKGGIPSRQPSSYRPLEGGREVSLKRGGDGQHLPDAAQDRQPKQRRFLGPPREEPQERASSPLLGTDSHDGPGLTYAGATAASLPDPAPPQRFRIVHKPSVKVQTATGAPTSRADIWRDLLKPLGFPLPTICAVLHFGKESVGEIFFESQIMALRFQSTFLAKGDVPSVAKYRLMKVNVHFRRKVSIHFRSIHLDPDQIKKYLQRHVDAVLSLEKSVDDAAGGVWDGGWVALVDFQLTESGPAHIPGVCFIMGHRGVLRYAGQPRTCYFCGDFSHVVSECPDKKCSKCGKRDHFARECREFCMICSGRHHSSSCDALMSPDVPEVRSPVTVADPGPAQPPLRPFTDVDDVPSPPPLPISRKVAELALQVPAMTTYPRCHSRSGPRSP
ncbi:zinc finger CCHC domain-containing protein 3-like [Protopterus annectens]|uniref:zinc finger CCHC domain-containing protein 3-like n=1 Tax=Protopterus annectens TaxID=7888 RepID=UPI001CFB5B6B|nr:zinc finger CCHC domain-containing protein 3-like [Protopterus annectens]